MPYDFERKKSIQLCVFVVEASILRHIWKTILKGNLKDITLHSDFFTNLDNLGKNSYGLFGDSDYY